MRHMFWSCWLLTVAFINCGNGIRLYWIIEPRLPLLGTICLLIGNFCFIAFLKELKKI